MKRYGIKRIAFLVRKGPLGYLHLRYINIFFGSLFSKIALHLFFLNSGNDVLNVVFELIPPGYHTSVTWENVFGIDFAIISGWSVLVQETTKHPEVEGPRSCQSSVSARNLQNTCSMVPRSSMEGWMIRDRSLLTSWTLDFRVFGRAFGKGVLDTAFHVGFLGVYLLGGSCRGATRGAQWLSSKLE